QVGPQHAAADLAGGVQEVMVVVPVDPEIDKTQRVQADGRQNLEQPGHVGAVGCVQLEHHDGNENRDHGVTEGFQPGLGHGAPSTDGSVRVAWVSASNILEQDSTPPSNIAVRRSSSPKL